MKNKISFLLEMLVFGVLVFILGCSKEAAENIPAPSEDRLTLQEQAMVSDLNDRLETFQGADPNLPLSDLQVLDFLGEAKIVGLGEATHGTREFFQMKHRLFRYLVEKQGFRVLAFEFGFVQGLLLNEMLMSGEGDVDAFVRKRETIYYWPWSTEEVSVLFQWIQDYNRGKADSDKIQVFGVDCQSMVFAQRVLPDMLKAYDPVFAEMIAQKLQVYPYPNYYGDVPDASLQEVRSKVLNDLRFVQEQVRSNAAAIATAISSEQYRLVEHMVRLLFQVEEVDYTGRINFVNGGVTRDRYMAENVNWIFEHLGEVKVAIWGHNGHVANDDYYLNFAPGSMGYHLKNAHGDAYQIIGFSFAKGTFNALQENNNSLSFRVFKFDDIPLEDSWNYYLHLADADNFMIKMSDLQSSDIWRSWLGRERRHLWIGAEFNNNWSMDDYYISKRMDRLYDVMIHFDNTTASTLLWE